MNKLSIAIVDSGLGNSRSVANAFSVLGYGDVPVTPHAADLENASHIVLPGVGAFGEGMSLLAKKDLIGVLRTQVLARKKPFLGICLGMQLLATSGSEMGRYEGLNWIEGRVDRLPLDTAQYRLPHVGWNEVRVNPSSRLFAGLHSTPQFYFVHSYHFSPAEPDVIAGTCDYGVEFTAAVESRNICGVQFHPEKSQRDGLQLLNNFIRNFSAPES